MNPNKLNLFRIQTFRTSSLRMKRIANSNSFLILDYNALLSQMWAYFSSCFVFWMLFEFLSQKFGFCFGKFKCRVGVKRWHLKTCFVQILLDFLEKCDFTWKSRKNHFWWLQFGRCTARVFVSYGRRDSQYTTQSKCSWFLSVHEKLVDSTPGWFEEPSGIFVSRCRKTVTNVTHLVTTPDPSSWDSWLNQTAHMMFIAMIYRIIPIPHDASSCHSHHHRIWN